MNKATPVGYLVKLLLLRNGKVLDQKDRIIEWMDKKDLGSFLDNWVDSWNAMIPDQHPPSWRISAWTVIDSQTVIHQYNVILAHESVSPKNFNPEIHHYVELTVIILNNENPTKITFKKACWKWMSQGYDVISWVKDENN